jgi:lysophospholipase L1-like esterase
MFSNRLRRLPLILAGSIFLSVISAVQAEPSAAQITFFLAGDSTMATQALVPPTPARGWGQMLQPYFTENVRVENHAASGHSTKSFSDSGRWQRILERIKPGDFVLIQFGHNDSKPDEGRRTEPFGTYRDNLQRFVRDVRERQGSPLLATSVVRNAFNADGSLRDTHGDYIVVTRKVAEEMQVPLLDLSKKTGELLAKLGPEKSKRLFNNVEPGEYEKYPEGFKDGTHYNTLGASRTCDLTIEEILVKVPQLAKEVKLGPQTTVGGNRVAPQ